MTDFKEVIMKEAVKSIFPDPMDRAIGDAVVTKTETSTLAEECTTMVKLGISKDVVRSFYLAEKGYTYDEATKKLTKNK